MSGDEAPRGDSALGWETDTEALYDQAPCAYLSTRPDGTIIRANQTFLDWIGSSRDQLIGQVRFQSLLTIGARIYYETHYAPLLQIQGFVNEIALEVRRADGSIRPVVASARQLRTPGGEPALNRVALFDSTDRRRYEQELLQARKRAEQAARELSDADRRKNEFIAMLAHELRNPLAPIRHAVEVLRRSDQAGAVGKASGVLERQVGQMVRLIEDLVDVSRIGQNKLTVRRVPVDLASVVHHALEASESLLQSAGLIFTPTLSDGPIDVNADDMRLAQVIENILNNAAKFTPREGSVTLIMEREGDEAVIRIRDSGIGIDPAHLPRVFDLFMQADPALERRGGLGIGLMLAKSLVEQHDGRISVHSDGPGTGTEFVIRLPALSQSLQGVSKSASPHAPEMTQTPKRVLVVDDNHDSADLMAMLLDFFGHDVRVAHDGLTAVEMSAEFQPHVVLLDLGLPRLNGYEAARRIRALSGVQPLLVALTGWGQEEDRRRSAEAGFDAHLVKPVDHDVLTKLIADLPPDGSGERP